MTKTKHFLIAGPTASGKSSLAIRIAKQINGVIVNADALQVYNAYQILTARPNDYELKVCPHLLYGHVGNEILNYSVGKWLKEMEAILKDCDKPLVIVGGTGLYFDALLNGLSEIPPVSANLRDEISLRLQLEGLEKLIDDLKVADPKICTKIDLKNSRRVARAYEVWKSTGKPLSYWQSQKKAPLLELNLNTSGLVLMPAKEQTNYNIVTRLDKMLELGAIDEVKEQISSWDRNLPANKALGAEEIAQYLRDKISYEEMRENIIIATRQYAKRQRSWFRSKMKDWNWVTSEDDIDALLFGFTH